MDSSRTRTSKTDPRWIPTVPPHLSNRPNRPSGLYYRTPAVSRICHFTPAIILKAAFAHFSSSPVEIIFTCQSLKPCKSSISLFSSIPSFSAEPHQIHTCHLELFCRIASHFSSQFHIRSWNRIARGLLVSCKDFAMMCANKKLKGGVPRISD